MSSLTFGPKWVRDLSSGDTPGAAAPPNTPAPRKYKLAEFRYGREEMLSLVVENYEIPLGLKEFEDIIKERPIVPLAFIPISEEEERCQMGGVNSILVLKITGRGGPGMRGRGGSPRGRGRGRGDYSLHRSASSSDENYQRWPADTGNTRGGYHRPVGRGDSLEGGSSRVGYDPTRSRLSSDGSYPTRNVEYWRSNSKEASPAAETPAPTTEEEWRNNKPWTGKKGSADNSQNWRDAKVHDDHEALTRTKSWSRTNHEREDNLPEWLMDDSVDDNMPGSFDASGQFRVLGKDLNDEDSAFLEEKLESPRVAKESEIKKLEAKVTHSKNEKQEKSNVTKETKFETNGPLEIQKPDNKHEPNKGAKDLVPNNTETLIETQQEKTESLNVSNISPPLINQTQEPNIRHKEDEYELNLDHITSMVAKLDDESDEEELSHTQHTQDASVDPSIVFAKKAEPGKVINGLQDWIYRDPQGEIQGPFTNDEMAEWFRAGYFTMRLLVRRVCDEIFLPLGDVLKLWGRLPFSAKSQPPPVTSQMLMQHQLQQQQQQQQTQLQQLLQQQQQQQQQKQQQNQQQNQQQQLQQQQMRQALLNQFQVKPEGRPSNLGVQPELSVWGDASTGTTPVSKASPWTPIQEQSAWNMRKSPQNALSLRQIEEEQQSQAQTLDSHARQDAMDKENVEQAHEQEQNLPESPIEEEEFKQSPKKKNKKKNKSKDNEGEEKKKNEAEQKQREKEELQRKALEALKHQQQIQQQQKLAEQQRLIDEQNRREEEIRHKQQQQQQQMQQQQQQQQQLIYQKYQHEQQRKQQAAMAPSWSRVSGNNGAPSLAEIQRVQERKEAELKEHMKAIQQHEMMQQQQQQQRQARWNQQQGFQQQQQRVKSLVEIQQEEAKKLMQHQHLKQQQQQQQQRSQQNYNNSLPWNAAGQPIHAKPNNDSNTMFWDDVMGVNGSANNQQKMNQQQRKSYGDFPPVSSSSKASKRDTKEQEIVNRIFQAQTPSTEFVNWVERNLPAVKRAIDVPTVVAFLQDVESPYEIQEYMRSYLGDSREQKEFVREFLERRNKTEKQDKSSGSKLPGKVMDSRPSVPQYLNDDDGFEDVKKNKKKKKMQKVDPNLLGFQCNAGPEIMNRQGEVESVASAVAKSKK